jgi:EAL domain-containing protein (putative c-di-GMP-specific phosphodiesterase class I)
MKPPGTFAVERMSASLATESITRVLVVDDEPAMLRALSRLLEEAGHQVTTASNGHDAVRAVTSSEVDVVISDVSMPGMSGIELLRAIRSHDPDVPVLLMTGAPSVQSAAQAVQYGAMRYLLKPVDASEVEDVVVQAARLHRLARMKRLAMALTGHTPLPSDRAGLEAAFARALSGLVMAYQPILRASDHSVAAYEALMRSEEASLPDPSALLTAAERLHRLPELGRAVRARTASGVSQIPDGALLFVNLHPADLEDPDLLDPSSPLAQHAQRVVLEVTERAALDGVNNLPKRVTKLRELGYRLAVDDLGAGYAGLSTFAYLEPEFVKLDMSLVRGVQDSPTRQRIIRSVAALCHEMNMSVVVEGVETYQERDALLTLDCDLFQGYLFARPGPPFPPGVWS